MTRVKSIAAAGALATLALCAATVGAQQSNTQEVTYITFSEAVEMPGVFLEPGTYEFRLADTGGRNVIQVLRKDRSEVMGQWTFVQSERERTTDETVVMFREAPEGTTPAVQYWYFPGEDIGKEFIYPEDQAERIAERTGQRVRTEEGFVSPAATADAGQPAPAPPAAEPGVDVELDADADIQEDAEIADADVDADADDRDVPRTASAPAQPSAPAGSTTGSRGEIASGRAEADADADDVNLQADADLEADAAAAAADADLPAEAPQQDAQIAEQQIADADASRPVGTSGAADDQAAAAAGVQQQGELPRTASPLALTGLIGLLSLAGAAGLRRFYR